MTINKLAGIVGSITVLIGALFAVENRYAHAEETKKQAAADKAELYDQMQAKDREQRLETLRLKIQFLNSKAKLTQDEKDELEFTREQVKKLQAEALK